jgi:hypothetical protein
LRVGHERPRPEELGARHPADRRRDARSLEQVGPERLVDTGVPRPLGVAGGELLVRDQLEERRGVHVLGIAQQREEAPRIAVAEPEQGLAEIGLQVAVERLQAPAEREDSFDVGDARSARIK